MTSRTAAGTDQLDKTPSFFVPGTDSRTAQKAYDALRDGVGVAAGRVTRPQRIFSIACRVSGRDCDICVGGPDPDSGDTVLAIFDAGSHRFGVCTEGAADTPSRWLDKQVYSFDEFA